MTNFRRAFMDTMKILQVPAETHDSGAPSDEVQLQEASVLAANLGKASPDKLLSASGLDAYTYKLMTFYNGELAKIKASISATSFKDYVGTLGAGATAINVGATLYRPALYLDGVRMDKNSFTFSGTTINLKEAYSKKYSVVWYVEDTGSPARATMLAAEEPVAQPLGLFTLPTEESELELSHIFTNNNLNEEWNLGADISQYKRLSLILGDGTILEMTTKILIKNKTINAKVVFMNSGEDAYYEENVIVLELVDNYSIRIKAIYDYTKERINSLSRDLKCEIVLEK